MKVCADCKHVDRGHPFGLVCRHPSALKVDRVSGRMAPFIETVGLKNVDLLARCDAEGWFEAPKPKRHWWML